MEKTIAELLTMKAAESIGTAVKEITAIGESRTADTTHFINAAHGMGKYHAYMDILSDLDMEQLIVCHDKHKEDCEKVLNGMEKLYEMMGV